MKKVFIVALVGAELAMLATALPKKFTPGDLIAPPPVVDRKWAKAMVRRTELAARQDVQKAAHRQAIDACLGPNGANLSPTRYDAKVKRCEAMLAGAAPAEPEQPQYYAPSPSAAPEQAAAQPAASAVTDDAG